MDECHIKVTVTTNPPTEDDVITAPVSRWVIAILGVMTEDQRRRTYDRVKSRVADLHPEWGAVYPSQIATREPD